MNRGLISLTRRVEVSDLAEETTTVAHQISVRNGLIVPQGLSNVVLVLETLIGRIHLGDP